MITICSTYPSTLQLLPKRKFAIEHAVSFIQITHPNTLILINRLFYCFLSIFKEIGAFVYVNHFLLRGFLPKKCFELTPLSGFVPNICFVLIPRSDLVPYICFVLIPCSGLVPNICFDLIPRSGLVPNICFVLIPRSDLVPNNCFKHFAYSDLIIPKYSVQTAFTEFVSCIINLFPYQSLKIKISLTALINIQRNRALNQSNYVTNNV